MRKSLMVYMHFSLRFKVFIIAYIRDVTVASQECNGLNTAEIGYNRCIARKQLLCLFGYQVHYFLRIFLSVILARFFKKKISILQESKIWGICLTTDVDTFFYHMNNARFVRELDFARVDFYERTGLYQCIKRKNGAFALGTTTIRYRRFLRLFHRYILTSKVVYWDEQGIYMEHRFINPNDKFVNAIAIGKTRLMNCSVDEIMGELLESSGENISKIKPQMPLEVAKWLESNEISSAHLRAESGYPKTTVSVTPKSM
ncbi:hypothetical protein FQA39_LY10267 [Lamprigera yunnana]|nr:hypothetical protein FQA39_LY10267 [Lamprigera yunnana]